MTPMPEHAADQGQAFTGHDGVTGKGMGKGHEAASFRGRCFLRKRCTNMPSNTERILTALADRLRTVPKARVERNTAVPEKIPAGGLIVLRDGDPGEPEQTLGGVGGVYYAHAVEIEIYIDASEAAARDAAFDALVQKIGTALDADPTLGGLAFGMTCGRPEVDTEAVVGAPAIKTGTVEVIVEYETETPLG